MTHHQVPFDLTHALEEVRVPAAAVHRDGRILWLNRGAIELVGDRVGQPYIHVIARVIGTFGLAYPAGPASDESSETVPELTARQHQALALLAEGLGTAEIAARLGVAAETARNHIRALLRQLNVHSRLEAVVRAYRLGLLRPT